MASSRILAKSNLILTILSLILAVLFPILAILALILAILSPILTILTYILTILDFILAILALILANLAYILTNPAKNNYYSPGQLLLIHIKNYLDPRIIYKSGFAFCKLKANEVISYLFELNHIAHIKKHMANCLKAIVKTYVPLCL